jgi:hypothetical protein
MDIAPPAPVPRLDDGRSGDVDLGVGPQHMSRVEMRQTCRAQASRRFELVVGPDESPGGVEDPDSPASKVGNDTQARLEGVELLRDVDAQERHIPRAERVDRSFRREEPGVDPETRPLVHEGGVRRAFSVGDDPRDRHRSTSSSRGIPLRQERRVGALADGASAFS